MKFKSLLTATAAAATLVVAGSGVASADWYSSHHPYVDADHDGRPDNGSRERHDRDGYRDNARYDARHPLIDRDHDGRPDSGSRERHDRDGYRDNLRYDARMDRRDYHRMISNDRVYEIVRSHRYRYIGAPYWYRGHYGVRAYDPYGKIVFVGLDPYSGAWGGIYFRF